MPRPGDANGNLTSDGTWAFAYDAENRLRTAAKSGTSASYQYDPLGRRQAKVANGVTTSFLSDGDEEIAEYTGAGGLLRRYVPGPATDQPIAMVTPSGGSNLHSWFHANRQGSTVTMSNDAGTVAEGPYTYDAYGQGAPLTGVPFKYTGRRLDAETGLYYYRARYYSASLGRFLQTDPIGYRDQMNLYGYVGNDPLNTSDPKGLVSVVNSCTSDNKKCAAAAKMLNERNAAVTPKINALKDDQKFKLKDGTVVTGAQIKQAWNNTTIELTERTDFGNGGVGRNTASFDQNGNFKSAVVEMNGNSAYQYSVAAGTRGQNMLLFHEVGHNLPNGLRSNREQWSAFQRRDGGSRDWGRSDREWWLNERVANSNAFDVSATVGEEVYDVTGLGH